MGDFGPEPPNPERPADAETRLESWKEIAAYLKRDVRTVQRWERLDGLPVYRRPQRRLGGVFAYRSEIDAWWSERSSRLESRGDDAHGGSIMRRRVTIAFAIGAPLVLLFLISRPSGSLQRVAVSFGLRETCTVPRDLMSVWHAEGDARDAAGGNHGVPEDGASFGPGRAGQAFLLDGQAARVRVPTPRMTPVSDGELTIAAWVRFRSVINPRAPRRTPYDDMSLIDKMAPSPDRMRGTWYNLNGWRLLKQSDHRFWFCLGGRDVNRCGSPTNTVFSSVLAVNDTWYHVAAVKSGEEFCIYVNGVMEDSRPLPPSELLLDTGGADLLLGSNATEGSFLNGALDEVMLFERALARDEIRLLMRAVSTDCWRRSSTRSPDSP